MTFVRYHFKLQLKGDFLLEMDFQKCQKKTGHRVEKMISDKKL